MNSVVTDHMKFNTGSLTLTGRAKPIDGLLALSLPSPFSISRTLGGSSHVAFQEAGDRDEGGGTVGEEPVVYSARPSGGH